MSNTIASPKTNIMSNERVGNIRRGALAWLSPKIYPKSLQLLQAVKFELITDGECWLRGSGKITVRMRIQFENVDYNSPPTEIRVYSSETASVDPKTISAKLADILSEYLHSRSHIALIKFTGWTRTNMMIAWTSLATQWLIDDIRDDAEIFNYLTYLPKEGRKIIVENSFGIDSFELDITFQDGECWFSTMVDQLSAKINEYYGESNIFTKTQLLVAEKAMAPAITNAVRDEIYCYPYSQDTKNKLSDMAPYIKMAVSQFPGISALALAGAMADALDDNLESRLQQQHDLTKRYLREAVRRNTEKLDPVVSGVLNLLSQGDPLPDVFDAAGLIWTLMSLEDKQAALDIVTVVIYEGLNYLGHEIAKSMAVSRDKHNDSLVMIKMMKEIDFKKLSEEQRIKIRNEIDKQIASVLNPSQALCFYLCGGNSDSTNILINARNIEKSIGSYRKAPAERDFVTKWERFITISNG